MSERINIYQVTDCDHVAAENPKDAQSVIIKMLGEDHAKEHFDDFGDPVFIPHGQLDIIKIKCTDEPGEPMTTFKKYLDEMLKNNEEFPCHFSTTEY